MQRGEIWWGSPRLPGGSGKRRPYLVVSHDAFNRNDRYPKTMVVHLTTVLRPGRRYDWEVELARGTAGLPYASLVKCEEIYTVLKTHLVGLVGTLPAADLQRVDLALSAALGLPSS